MTIQCFLPVGLVGMISVPFESGKDIVCVRVYVHACVCACKNK